MITENNHVDNIITVGTGCGKRNRFSHQCSGYKNKKTNFSHGSKSLFKCRDKGISIYLSMVPPANFMWTA